MVGCAKDLQDQMATDDEADDCFDEESEDEKEPDVGDGESRRAIPVTILSGFLGSGKTTLVKHILESKDHQLKVAVIVNDMAELNIDATLVAQQVTHAKKEVIQLQNGCICCTLRGDLIREVNRLQELGQFDYVLIESTGIAEPQQVAESFCMDPETAALADDPAKMLWNVARLDTCVTVVDVLDFPRHLTSLKRFREEFSDGLDKENNDEEGQKSIAHLLVEQVEFANVILLNKIDLVSQSELGSITKLIQTLNPTGKIVTTRYSVLNPQLILNTKMFSMAEAEKSQGWLLSLSSPTEVVSEADEYGVSSFVYRARKPFHPARLHHWIDQIFCFADQWKTVDSDRRLDVMTSRFGQIFRSKGFCWIAGRDTHTGGWAHSGRLIVIDPMIPWYASQPEADWEVEDDEDLANIKRKFVGEHGDRRQEIVFIGIKLQESEITDTLNRCLLTEEEMKSHSYASDGKYLDTLPPWTYHYAEPSVLAATLRQGQVHKFQVAPGMNVTISSLALNVVLGKNAHSSATVKVWLDFVTENNQRTSSSLLATLRTECCEQYSLSLNLPGSDSDNSNGPMMLRMERQTSGVKRPTNGDGLDDTKTSEIDQCVEVHVLGSVFVLVGGAAEEDAGDQADEHNCDGHGDQKQRTLRSTEIIDLE
jgi:G3E family GTPase